MKILTTQLILIAGLVAGVAAEWKPLFNGENLDGWTQRGGEASYHVEDGAIVGVTKKGTPNTFLCTEREDGDFILELEFQAHPGLNSGVQIRSESRSDYRSGRVHGYQVEIDPSDRAWTGGIYDEARRGWLNPLTDNEAAQKAYRKEGWNQFRVEAVGDWIRTWLNGVPAADLRDSMTLQGFIALQVHGTSSDAPMSVRWRNIRILDLGRHVWKPLFDGETLNGWHSLPGGEWKVVDGAIVGSSEAAEKRHGLLVTGERFKDFTARLKFNLKQGDSGFYFRAEEVDNFVGVNGFQVEVDETFETGGLYETGGRAWVVQYDKDEPTEWYQKGEWNDVAVSAHGRRVVVHINSLKTAELTDDPGRTDGHLALQLHGGMDMLVSYKDIEILRPE